MAEKRFTPGPGKTAARLIEDLLDYDPLSKKARKVSGRNLLADPAPFFPDDGKLAPARKAPDDCRHTLMKKDGLVDAPLSNDERPGRDTIYIVECYCSTCRCHYKIKETFSSIQEVSQICDRSDVDNPMHHFRLVKSTDGIQEMELVGDAYKYDPLIESHQWTCTAEKCPAALEIRISKPRLKTSLLNLVTEPKNMYQRGRAQIQKDPDRYTNQNPATVLEALGYLRAYLTDAKAVKNPADIKRIAKRNKKYMIAFADECDELFTHLDFQPIEEESGDPNLGPSYFWQLPIINNKNRKFIDDVIQELSILMERRPQEEHRGQQTVNRPLPALTDIKRSLGCHEYLTRSRTIEVDSTEHPYLASLGALENFTDDVLGWAYDRQRACDPDNKAYYLDCLTGIANGRGSSDLQMKVVMATSAGEHGLKAIQAAYQFFALNPDDVQGDDHIMGLYKSRIESAPRQKEEAKNCLLIIAKQRNSAKIEALVNDATMTFNEALEFLNVTADTASDSIEAAAIAMSLDADKSRVARALRAIANQRSGDFTLSRAAASMEGGEAGSTIDIGEAYNRLQIHQRTIPDETIFAYYKSLSDGAPSGSKDSYTEAFRAIALERKSHFLLRKLDDPNADVKADTADPVGLDNIGNTCYLNSLLQYYYTVKPIRDMVIDFQNHRMIISEENLRKKRAGGRIITKAEIIKAQKFVDELHDLFENLKTASTRSVKPTRDLAELTIFSTEKEETFRRKSVSSPQGPPTISSVLEGAVYGPQWPPPSEAPLTPEDDIQMIDRPAEQIGPEGDDSSEATLVDMDQLPPLVPDAEIPNYSQISNTASHATVEMLKPEPNGALVQDDLDGDAVMVNGSDIKIEPPQEKPPPIPPRNKSGLVIQTNETKNVIADNDFWRFGVQQDVTEVIGNVIFRLQCAIKPTSIEAGTGEQVDVIRNTFYGTNTTYTEKARGLERKTEAWSYLIIFPGQNVVRDIYEAIDVVYDVQSVEVENATCLQYTSISKLPPILQIQIQRTDYSAEQGAFKNRTPVIFPETIYLDRYVDTGDPNSAVMQRRRATWEWKSELRKLEARQIALVNKQNDIPVTEALVSMKDYLSLLQEDEIDGIPIDASLPEALDERTREIASELDDLNEQIRSLKQKLQDQFTDMRQYEYKLQSVFIHRGEAGGGHYWVYIYDFERDIWREYNDEHVTVVQDRRRIFDDQGSAGNPYFLVYVKSQDKDTLVDAVCRDVQEVQMTDINLWQDNVDEAASMSNGTDEQMVESSHIEHVKPRPLRPKPASDSISTWENDWPPPDEDSRDANGYKW